MRPIHPANQGKLATRDGNTSSKANPPIRPSRARDQAADSDSQAGSLSSLGATSNTDNSISYPTEEFLRYSFNARHSRDNSGSESEDSDCSSGDSEDRALYDDEIVASWEDLEALSLSLPESITPHTTVKASARIKHTLGPDQGTDGNRRPLAKRVAALRPDYKPLPSSTCRSSDSSALGQRTSVSWPLSDAPSLVEQAQKGSVGSPG
jgi:hypothetical protein